jgi:hypothetical protein
MKKTLKSIGAKTAKSKPSYIEFARNYHNAANKITYEEFLNLIQRSQESKLKKAS